MPSTKSDRNPHNEGKKYVEFKPADGENEMKITPNMLSITWGKDDRYWHVPDDGGVAELYQVSWLEVTGCVSETVPGKEYEVGFQISFAPDAFGWSQTPVYMLVKRGKTEKFKAHKLILDSSSMEKKDVKATAPAKKDVKATAPAKKINAATTTDQKLDIDDDDNSKIYFGLYEVWRGNWKAGLKIHHAFVKQI